MTESKSVDIQVGVQGGVRLQKSLEEPLGWPKSSDFCINCYRKKSEKNFLANPIFGFMEVFYSLCGHTYIHFTKFNTLVHFK